MTEEDIERQKKTEEDIVKQGGTEISDRNYLDRYKATHRCANKCRQVAIG